MRAQKAVALVGIVVGSAAVLAAITCFFLAIWTIGPNSARWVGTGFILCVSGFALTCAACTLWSDLR